VKNLDQNSAPTLCQIPEFKTKATGYPIQRLSADNLSFRCFHNLKNFPEKFSFFARVINKTAQTNLLKADEI